MTTRDEFEKWHATNYKQPLTKWGERYKNSHVQGRWQGWVAAAGASPVGSIDGNATERGAKTQADAHLRALLRYTEDFYASAMEHGMKAGPVANAVAHVERVGKALHQLVHTWATVSTSRASPVEPAESVLKQYNSEQTAVQMRPFYEALGGHAAKPSSRRIPGGAKVLACADRVPSLQERYSEVRRSFCAAKPSAGVVG